LAAAVVFVVERLERPNAAGLGSEELDALVVLGCRVHADGPSRALESRLALAHTVSRSAHRADRASTAIVLSGGRLWSGQREADVMADWLVARGIPREVLVLESASLTTQQNARNVADVVATHGWCRIGLVTSDFHMLRAVRLFRREGLRVEPFGAHCEFGFFTEKRLLVRELCATVLGYFERR
jgi:uncharacterized SAM-binding protein YcdF (DUF218 family)